MNKGKRKRCAKYIIVDPTTVHIGVDYLCVNDQLAVIENHISRLREIYLSKPEEFPYMPRKLLDAERRRRQLEELLTGYFDLIVVLPEE